MTDPDEKPKEVWYRFYNDTRASSGWDEDNWAFTDYLRYDEFPVVKHTPVGVWLDLGWGNKRWVSKTSRKRFAHADKREALESFIERKKRQHCIYQARADRAKKFLDYARKRLDNETFADLPKAVVVYG